MRTRAILVLITSVAVVTGVPLAFAGEPNPEELTFDERVSAQPALERVYLTHRADSTRSLETAELRQVVAAKLQRYLAQSQGSDRAPRELNYPIS